MTENKRKPIILCAGANGRAVIFGFVDADPVPGEAVTLHDARMVLYWSAKCGGLFGLAAGGPKEGTRLTPAIASTVATQWKECLTVSADAVPAFAGWEPYVG